mgnify:CR=1 FL=1
MLLIRPYDSVPCGLQQVPPEPQLPQLSVPPMEEFARWHAAFPPVVDEALISVINM